MLASASPRRRELLAAFGVPFEVVAADIDETARSGEAPVSLARRLAAEKAARVAAEVGEGVVVLGADTIVDVDGEMLAKPTDPADAGRMLTLLSGRTHLVHTAVAVGGGVGDVRVEHSTTAVAFVELTTDVIDWYVGTGEPFDKAGGYAIQGVGGVLVASVDGSVSNVVGLPLDVVTRLLADRGRLC